MILGFVAIPLLSLVVLLLKLLERISRRIGILRKKLYDSLFWSQQITLLNESFAIVSMCALINLLRLTFDSKCEIVNSVLTVAFSALCITVPIIILILLLTKLPHFEKRTIMKKYGELIEGLDRSKGKIIVLAPINFLLRRLLLVAAVVLSR